MLARHAAAEPARTRLRPSAAEQPRVRRLLPVAALAAALLLLTLLAADPALAASQYNGGADDYPLFIPNDHTAVAIHFTAHGLSAGKTYYVKVRFSPGPAPAGGANRGFTWNQGSGQWVQQLSDWPAFPTVTTDAGGTAAAWEFVKFGDTRIATDAPATYYILVSLSVGGQGNTFNGNVDAPVTVIDMATRGLWLHNGAPTGAGSGARVEADQYPLPDPTASPAAAPVVLGLTQTEANGVDENGDGIVDNEGAAGDFRLAAPTGADLVVRLGGVIWPLSATGMTYPTADADCDIALGAADATPPARVTSLSGTSGTTSAHLTWSAAADNIGVTAYWVYRWVDPGADAPNTAQPMLVKKVTAPATSCDDQGLTTGTAYSYEVRAVDAAGNVGPRSNTVILTPGTVPTDLTATPRNGLVKLAWTNPTEPGFDSVEIVRKDGTTSPTDLTDGTQVYLGAASSFDDTTVTNGTTYSYAIWAHDTVLGWSQRVTAAAVTPDGTPPGDITFAEAIGHDHHVTLDWHNPTDADFDHAVILRRADHYPTWAEKGDAQTTEVAVDQFAAAVTDSGIVNGTRCYYSLWAVDKADNHSVNAAPAGPATPQAVAAVTMAPRSAVIGYAHTASLTAHLTINGLGATAPIEVQWSANGKSWKPLRSTVTNAAGNVTVKVKPAAKTYYRVRYAGNQATAAAVSSAVVVTPQVLLGAPAAPASVRRAASFALSGALKPRHAAGSHVVRVYCYRLKGGHWVYVRTYVARTITYSTYSKYTLTMSLPAVGKWRLRAYAPADAQHAATWSTYRSVTVK